MGQTSTWSRPRSATLPGPWFYYRITMNSAEFEHLLEMARRRPLTPEEEARVQSHLAASPSDRNAWEEEVGLTRLLHELPDAPLASNFTAQVLLALEHKGSVRRPKPRALRWFGLHRPALRAAWSPSGPCPGSGGPGTSRGIEVGIDLCRWHSQSCARYRGCWQSTPPAPRD